MKSLLLASLIASQVFASFYTSKECARFNHAKDCPTASGMSIYTLERQHIMFCAYNDAPMWTMLRVTNIANGKHVDVRVLDRGGFKKYGRKIDLCQRAFAAIADPKAGVIQVKIERC